MVTIPPSSVIVDEVHVYRYTLDEAGTQEQICWFHKSGNVLDKMPKSVQSQAKTMLREMWQAPSLEKATEAYDQFCEAYYSPRAYSS